jgi:hypothetical protein
MAYVTQSSAHSGLSGAATSATSVVSWTPADHKAARVRGTCLRRFVSRLEPHQRGYGREWQALQEPTCNASWGSPTFLSPSPTGHLNPGADLAGGSLPDQGQGAPAV